MGPVQAGAQAPEIQLKTTEGGSFSLQQESANIPVLAAFFKAECPTCQYTFPFLERIYKAYPRDRVKVVGISQNDATTTQDFMKQFGVTFPIALDDTKSYPASRAYGLTTVPSTYFVGKGGKVEAAVVGWVKDEMEALNEAVARATGIPPAQIFKYGEKILDFKAG